MAHKDPMSTFMLRTPPEKYKAIRIYCIENDMSLNTLINKCFDEVLATDKKMKGGNNK